MVTGSHSSDSTFPSGCHEFLVGQLVRSYLADLRMVGLTQQAPALRAIRSYREVGLRALASKMTAMMMEPVMIIRTPAPRP